MQRSDIEFVKYLRTGPTLKICFSLQKYVFFLFVARLWLRLNVKKA